MPHLIRKGMFCFALSMGMAVHAHGQAPDVRLLPDVPQATFLAVGDFNGDGSLDLALTETILSRNPDQQPPTHRLHLLYQKNRTFAMPPDKTIDLPAGATGLAVGDFDKDGKCDVAVGLRGIRSISVFLGAERFEKEYRCQYNNDSGADGLSAGRVNRNGLADFLTGAAWRQWQGNDRFGEAYFAGPERNDNWRSTLADLDGNGTDDVIFTTYWPGKLTTPANNRIRICYGPFLKMFVIQPTDAAEVVTLNSPFMESERPLLGQVLVGDLNGDDQLDLIVPGPGVTLIYFQNSPTGFSDKAGPSLSIKGVVPLLAADLDGNGLTDLVLRHVEGKALSLWFQQKGVPLSADWAPASRQIALSKPPAAAVRGDAGADGGERLFVTLEGGGLAVVPLPRP